MKPFDLFEGNRSETEIVLFVIGTMVICIALLSYFVLAPEYEKRFQMSTVACKKEQLKNSARMKTKKASKKDKDSGDEEEDQSEFDCKRQVLLRKRALLKKLEDEENGTFMDTFDSKSSSSDLTLRKTTTREVVKSSFTQEQLELLKNHSADCSTEVAKLDETRDPLEILDALRKMNDILGFNLTGDFRDMNKVTVFCNSLLKYDGLNRLRTFETSSDEEIRLLSTSIIEKAVPAIWH
jgi:hypothetical protein